MQNLTNIRGIKSNLIKHITHPVLWTQMVNSMEKMGIQEYCEAGPDDTLQKITARLCPEKIISSLLQKNIYNNITYNP